MTKNKVIAGFLLVTLFFGASVMAEVKTIGENIKSQTTAAYKA